MTSTQDDTAKHRTPGVGLSAAIAALGGLLFGFDTGIISSALLYLKEDFDLSDAMQQTVVASLLVGAVVGVLVGGPAADNYGRRRTLLGLSALFTVATIFSALAPGPWTLVAARLLLGVAIGASSLTVPVYLAEIAPPAVRGRLVSLHQLMIVVGILLAYLTGYALSADGLWRWMLALGTVPALAMLLGTIPLSETPRWLISRGHHDKADVALRGMLPSNEVAAEKERIERALDSEKGISYRDLFRPKFRPAVVLGVVVAATNQLVGVNAVIYYAPTILQQAGFTDSSAILGSVGIGTANLILTAVAVVLLDRIGRRPLILGGLVGVILALVTLGALYLLPSQDGAVGVGIVVALMVYQGCFAASLGVAIWLINSEIFPTTVRGKALGFGTVTHWGLDLLVSATVLTMIATITPTGMFWLFAACGGAGLIYMFRKLPETKGRPLEDIEADLRNNHTIESDTRSH